MKRKYIYLITISIGIVGILGSGMAYAHYHDRLWWHSDPQSVVAGTDYNPLQVKTLTTQEDLESLAAENNNNTSTPTPTATPSPTATPQVITKIIYVTPKPALAPVSTSTPTPIPTKTVCNPDIDGENAIIDQYNADTAQAYSEYQTALANIPWESAGRYGLGTIDYNQKVAAENKNYQDQIAQLTSDEQAKIAVLAPICIQVPVQ